MFAHPGKLHLMMQPTVVGVGANQKVAVAIVGLIHVDVVNHLAALQLATKHGLRNQHMLKAAAVVLWAISLINLHIPRPGQARAVNKIGAVGAEVGSGSALPFVAAVLVAKRVGLVAGQIWRYLEGLATIGALALDTATPSKAGAFFTQPALGAVGDCNATRAAGITLRKAVADMTARAANAVIGFSSGFIHAADFTDRHRYTLKVQAPTRSAIVEVARQGQGLHVGETKNAPYRVATSTKEV